MPCWFLLWLRLGVNLTREVGGLPEMGRNRGSQWAKGHIENFGLAFPNSARSASPAHRIPDLIKKHT